MNINRVSDETKASIKRKSAFGLPNRPSDAGIKAETIKEAFFKPVVDITNSSITEIDRVVDEINSVFSKQEILPSHTQMFYENDWVFDEVEELFFIEITPEIHNIEDFKRIKVYMSLLVDDSYHEVSLYNIKNDGSVILYSDQQVQGFVVIGTNQDGFINSNMVSVDNVDGLAKVAKTGLYNDLEGLPDLSQIVTNSENIAINSKNIADIIEGDIKVKSAEKADLADSAINATNAENAEYAETAGSATNATNAVNAIKNYNGTYSGFIKNNDGVLKTGNETISRKEILWNYIRDNNGLSAGIVSFSGYPIGTPFKYGDIMEVVCTQGITFTKLLTEGLGGRVISWNRFTISEHGSDYFVFNAIKEKLIYSISDSRLKLEMERSLLKVPLKDGWYAGLPSGEPTASEILQVSKIIE